jgi:hypothetical protein
LAPDTVFFEPVHPVFALSQKVVGLMLKHLCFAEPSRPDASGYVSARAYTIINISIVKVKVAGHSTNAIDPFHIICIRTTL